MFVVEIRIQGCEKFSEILPEALREIECAIEDIVGCSLLQIFDTLIVEDVSIRYIPTEGRMTTISTTNV
jgi:hypothetical protein